MGLDDAHRVADFHCSRDSPDLAIPRSDISSASPDPRRDALKEAKRRRTERAKSFEPKLAEASRARDFSRLAYFDRLRSSATVSTLPASIAVRRPVALGACVNNSRTPVGFR